MRNLGLHFPRDYPFYVKILPVNYRKQVNVTDFVISLRFSSFRAKHYKSVKVRGGIINLTLNKAKVKSLGIKNDFFIKPLFNDRTFYSCFLVITVVLN